VNFRIRAARKVLLVAAALLVAGIVTNVLVAWIALARVGSLSRMSPSPQTLNRGWPRPVPPTWPTSWGNEKRAWGFRYAVCALQAWGGPATNSKSQRLRYHCIAVTEVGWPLPALQTECWESERYNTAAKRIELVDEGQPSQTVWLRGIPVPWAILGFGRGSWKTLPVRPIWPGFALSSFGYATLWAAVCVLLARARRWRRRRRGLCARCGYDAHGLPGCPECGRL
jgi:hypothetical protein